MPRVHAVTDGTPESVEDDLGVMPRRVRDSLLHQLAEGERIVIRTRQHPVVLTRPLAWALGAVALYLWLDVGVHVGRRLLEVVGVAVLVAAGRLGWAELQRRYRWIVVTNKRILKHEGVLDVSVPMMRLTKVTDMTYRHTLLGELAGFGEIIIESAGQQQAIRELTFIPDPDEVNAALNSEIFGEKPREKRRRKAERPWTKLPRRRREDPPDDDGPRGGGPGGGGPGGGPGDRGPRDENPSGAGGVEVSSSGHPSMPRSSPQTWYRSSNLRPPQRLGDTGEIPVVRAGEPPVARRDAVPFDQDEAVPRPGADDGDPGDDRVREIPLYPPREWVDRS